MSTPTKHSTTGIIVHVVISVDPTKIDEFLKHLRPVYEAVIAEPQCTFFEVSRSQDEPGVFRFAEGWAVTKDWFEANQLTKDYYKPYVEATMPLWTKPRTIEFFDRAPGWVYAKPAHFTNQWPAAPTKSGVRWL